MRWLLVLLVGLACTASAQNLTTYEERCAWYAEHSALDDKVDIWADVARAHTGLGQFSLAYLETVEKLTNRIDGSDFSLPAIALLLFRYADSPIVPPEASAALRAALLDFQYWIDEGGFHGNLQYWSENHAVLYHASEYVIGSWMANETFTNSGMTGAEHRDKGRDLLLRWMDVRSRLGFNEYCSEVYATFVTAALSLVVELGPDQDVATRAAALLDLQLIDLSLNAHKGVVTGFRGRSYDTSKVSASEQSTSQVMFLLTGEGRTSAGGRGAVSLATAQRYKLPAAIEYLASPARVSESGSLSATGRVGIPTADGPQYGISYTDPADGIVWFGMGAYGAPDTVELFFDVADAYDLWEHEVWAPLQPIAFLADTGILPFLMELLWPISTGPVLGPISTAVYRTPHGALGTAVEYLPSRGAMQQHVWQASIGPSALVFSTHPGPIGSGYAFAEWTGAAAMPRSSLHERTLIALHQPPWPNPMESVYLNYTHAFFPASEFDRVEQSADARWTVGQLGDAYLALYSERPTTWQTEGEYAGRELLALGGDKNVFIAEIGDAEADGSFDAFFERVTTSTVDVTWEEGTGTNATGVLACIDNSNCFDPANPITSLAYCLFEIPVANPDAPCAKYIDADGLISCVGACDSDLCTAQCLKEFIVIEPPTFEPGNMSVEYSNRNGRVVTYSWNEPLRVTAPGESTVEVRPESMRYRNPYMEVEWDARQFDISAGGLSHCIDFDVPSRGDC